MELTETEHLLICGLITFGVEKEAIPGIICCLETEEQQNLMIDFLVDNPQANQSEILREVGRILDETED